MTNFTEAATKHRHMYHDSKLDLNVMQQRALRLSLGDAHHEPVNVTLHHHKRDEICPGKVHEDYKVQS